MVKPINITDVNVVNTIRFKRTKAISIPTLKMIGGCTVYVKFNSPIVGKPSKKLDGTMGEIFIAQVTNLDTGELNNLVIPTVLHTELLNNYNGETYVGKSFEIEKAKEKRGNVGKEYYTYSIYEVDSGE